MKTIEREREGSDVTDSVSEHHDRAPAVAAKLRRALRNATGVHLTAKETRDFAAAGALALATRLENEELLQWQGTTRRTSSATTGSTGVATEDPPTSGRSPPTSPEQERSYIKALGLEIPPG